MFTGKYERGKPPPEDSRIGRRPQAAERYFTDRNFNAVECLNTVAEESGHTPTELTLAWALSKPAIGSVIAGTSRPEQVKANCEAVDVSLSDDALAALDAIGA